MRERIAIIGSGFSSLSAACYLARDGYQVEVYEKLESLGGRARQFKAEGFTFDMGPSWYWMPDVFESFFGDFGKKPSDYYHLTQLDPGYRVYFSKDNTFDVTKSIDQIEENFEKREKGSSQFLKRFLADAKENYHIAMKDVVYKPGISPLELITPKTIKKLNQFGSNISKTIRKNLESEDLRQLLEFPVLFLGAKPQDTPAFYNFMNYADFILGTWQPTNGFYDVVTAMVDLGKSLGVTYHTSCPVEKILTEGKKATGIRVNNQDLSFDVVLAGADYQHAENLLPENLRQYSSSYWNKKTFAPSSLLFYVGFDKKLKNVLHHNLFFDANFKKHAEEIYDHPEWPSEPLFYANFTSITNPHTAPDGCENGFFLIPIAPDLEDTPQMREKYFDLILSRFEELTEQKVKDHILYKRGYCVADFKSDYNSSKGNAYGMANILTQTAFLRPKLKSKRVDHLFFTGQLTVPGPGVPPSLISGKIVSELISKQLKK